MISMGLCLAAGLIAGMLITGLLVAAREADDREEEWEPDDIRDIRGVFDEALGRLDAGRERYGLFCAATDNRDLVGEELLQECLDGINYLAMFVLKMKHVDCCVKRSPSWN